MGTQSQDAGHQGQGRQNQPGGSQSHAQPRDNGPGKPQDQQKEQLKDKGKNTGKNIGSNRQGGQSGSEAQDEE